MSTETWGEPVVETFFDDPYLPEPLIMRLPLLPSS